MWLKSGAFCFPNIFWNFIEKCFPIFKLNECSRPNNSLLESACRRQINRQVPSLEKFSPGSWSTFRNTANWAGKLPSQNVNSVENLFTSDFNVVNGPEKKNEKCFNWCISFKDHYIISTALPLQCFSFIWKKKNWKTRPTERMQTPLAINQNFSMAAKWLSSASNG